MSLGNAARSAADISKMSPSASSSLVMYARARPSWLGLHKSRRKAFGDRSASVPTPAAAPSAEPSQNSMRTGGGSPSTDRTIGASVSATDGASARVLTFGTAVVATLAPLLARLQLATTGRSGSSTQPDHDGGYIAEPAASPATSSA